MPVTTSRTPGVPRELPIVERWRRLTRRFLLAGFVSLLAAVALSGQTFEGKERVVAVEVPVNLIGPDGSAVRGLTKEDFEVRERGREREIIDFAIFDLETLRPTPGRIEAGHTVPAAARRHFILLFDLSFSAPSSIRQAQAVGQEFVLETLEPSDLAAVMTFSLQQGLRLLVTFTPDRAQLARAIDNLGGPDLLDRTPAQDPLQFLTQRRAAVPLGTPEGGAVGAVGSPMQQDSVENLFVQPALKVIAGEMKRQEQAYQRGRVGTWVRALGDLADALTGIVGPKHVVYFSEGFDAGLLMGDGGDRMGAVSRLEPAIVGQTVDSFEVYGDTSLLAAVHRVLGEFKKAGSTIHTVDISETLDPSSRTRREVLQLVARETGGAMVGTSGELGTELEEVLAASSVTYLLTFLADSSEPDGSYHRIKVRAAVPRGIELSYRPGYFAPEPYDELHPLERILLASDAIASAAPRRDIGIDVLAAAFRDSPGRGYVPVIIEIDGASVLVGHRGKTLPLEIYGYASDAQGEMRDFFTQVVTLDVEKGREPLLRSGVKFYGHFELSSGEHLVRVMVRNGATGRTGIASARVAVPGFAEGEPAAVGPFFPEPRGKWIMVRERSRIEEEMMVYPFTVNGETYIPAARPELPLGEPARFCLVAYHLGSGALRLEGEIVGEDGETVGRGELVLEERTVTGIDAYDKLLASFRPVGLEAGDYTLRVKLGRVGATESATASVPFTAIE